MVRHNNKNLDMVNIETFTKVLGEEFEDIDTNDLTPETDYRSIPDFSSMHALIIIAHIDSEYDVMISGEDLKNTATIRDLYTLVLERKSE